MRRILNFFALLAVLANLANATSSCHMLTDGEPALSGLAALQVVCVTHLGDEAAPEGSDRAEVDLCCHQFQALTAILSFGAQGWELPEMPLWTTTYPSAPAPHIPSAPALRLPPRAPPVQA